MNLKPVLYPLLQRFWPTPGPGGLANALSYLVHADASNMVHVTRHLDVMEVWQRDDDFSVRTYDERMTATTGPFILGMNELHRYAPDLAVIRRAIRREDAALVTRLAREETERAIAEVRAEGRIDVVKDVANVVPLRLVMRYFGLTTNDEPALLRLFQQASWYIFSFWSDPSMRAAAIAAGEKLRVMLNTEVARRRREDRADDGTVMGRFLSMTDGFADGDAGIARSIAGLCSGTLNAPIGMFANSVDKLLGLDDPQRERLHEIAIASRHGDASADAELTDYLFEAERFGVFPSILHRYAERDVTLAQLSSREKRIPKGTTVVVWPMLAAFDEDVYERPFDFVPGRPRWQYMGFGDGRHRCLGEHIGQALLKEMTRGLFALPRLRRAPGKAGSIQSRGIREAHFPESFVLSFDRYT